MQRTFGGYTLLEVMIFLAISSILLVAAFVAVKGQEAHTEFTSSMNEVNTKMQQWIDSTVNGLSSTNSVASASPSNYNCSIDPITGRPDLTNGGGNQRGSNPDCVSLGKAIQVSTSALYSNQIYAYTVIGRRVDPTTGALTDNLANSGPAPAIFNSINPPIDLTENYQIPNGTRVKCVLTAATCSASNPALASYMGGFFTSFNNQANNGTQNGASSLIAVQYPMNNGSTAPESSVVQNCIELSVGCSTAMPNLWPMQAWKVCFTNTRGTDTAELDINSTNGLGATTNLNFINC